MNQEVDGDRVPLVRIAVRLERNDAERLRELAHAQRVKPAVLARAAVLTMLDRGIDSLPAVPPAIADLPTDVAAALKILTPLTSNLFQLAEHVKSARIQLGLTEEAAAKVSAEIQRMRELARRLALRARGGALTAASGAHLASLLAAPGAQLNEIAASCNHAVFPALSEWSGPLKSVRAALENVA